jgi:hypothetical protein
MRIPAVGARLALATLTATLTCAATAAAAAPAVSLGGAARVTPTSATLTGKVNPRGVATTYFFQYGPTVGYGAVTPTTGVGATAKAVAAAADIGGLSPFTKYHYRLVAQSKDGTTRSGDRTFSSAKQPLGLSLAATPNPVPFGGGTTLTGNLSGTGNATQTIVLKQNPFPFTAGLQPFGNQVITDKAGNFSVALLGVPITTQYQASVVGKNVASPVLTVPVAVRVGSQVNHTNVKRGRKVVFTGSIRPARDGAQVAIQKLTSKSTWVTVAGTITRHRSKDLSTFRKSIRVRRGGSYRVFVGLQDGNYTSSVGRTITVHTHR